MTPYDVLKECLSAHWIAGKSGGTVVSVSSAIESCLSVPCLPLVSFHLIRCRPSELFLLVSTIESNQVDADPTSPVCR